MKTVVEFKGILVPLDGSPLSETALPLAAAIAGKFESKIIILRALDLGATTMLPHYSDRTVRMVLDAREHVRQEAKGYLKAQASELREQGFSVKTVLSDVAPAVGIMDAAVAEDVDLIVISTHGRGGLARWAFGSVADKVARYSPCPVLLVRQRLESASEAQSWPLRAKSSSDSSTVTLEGLCKLCLGCYLFDVARQGRTGRSRCFSADSDGYVVRVDRNLLIKRSPGGD